MSNLIVTSRGSSVKIKSYEDGQEYIKIKILTSEDKPVTPKQLKLAFEFVERVEDDRMDKGGGFWCEVKRHLPRYFIANIVKTIFQSATILVTLKLGISWIR